MSPTKVIPSFQVIAPADLLGDDAAALDFLASEFFLAKIYGNDSLEIAAPAELLPMLADPDMATPVALLIYAEDNPANASFFPFAEYSPEYQAARWAVRHGAPLRFIDLPASDRLGVAGGGIEDETAASADDDPSAGVGGVHQPGFRGGLLGTDPTAQTTAAAFDVLFAADDVAWSRLAVPTELVRTALEQWIR